MAYIYPNYKTKKAMVEAVKAGDKYMIRRNYVHDESQVITGEVFLEGPHHPQPHKWYAKVFVKDGKIVEIDNKGV